MRFAPLIAIFTLLGTSLLAQMRTTPTAMNREQYMASCIETAKSIPNVPAKEYCNCTYDNLLSQLTEEEVKDFIDFTSSGAEQDEMVAYAMSKPKIMNIIMGCMDPQNYNAIAAAPANSGNPSKSTSELSKKEMSDIKKSFIKECLNGLEANPVSKDFNEKTYCECAWEKIISTDDAMNFFLDSQSQSAQELIQSVAVKCLSEQLGK